MLVHSRWLSCLIIALIAWAVSLFVPTPFSTILYVVAVVFTILFVVFLLLWLLRGRDNTGARGPLV